MGYRVDYGPVMRRKQNPIMDAVKMQLMTTAFVLMFILGVKAYWPDGAQQLRSWLLPGAVSGTGSAVSELVEDLRDGTSLAEAVTAFCQQIIADAKPDE